jgi:type I restriction enzyme S subunit
MSEWRQMTLGEVCKAGDGGFIRTGPFGSQLHQSDYVDDPDGIPVVMPKDMSGGRIDLNSIARIGDETADRLSHHLLEAGDIILSRRGDVGRSVWVAEEDLPVLCGTGSMRIHPGDGGPVQREYLRYYLRSRAAIDYLEGRAVGATMPNLNAEIVAGLPIIIPPKDHQAKAAEILSTIDDLMKKSRRRIDLLAGMAQATYREWFVGFRYPGYESATFVDSLLGSIPEGWRAVRLAELVSTQYGYTESAQDEAIGPQYLRGMDINKTSFIDWSAVPYCPIDDKDQPRFQIRPGDVFVIRMADPGKVGICEVAVDAVFASYLVRLRPVDKRLTSYFLFFTLSDDVYQGWVTGASTGSTRKSASAKVMTEPLIVLPPPDVQARFQDAIEPLRSLLNLLLACNAQLAATRDLLLPKLVTGEIDVSEMDLDNLVEPVA